MPFFLFYGANGDLLFFSLNWCQFYGIFVNKNVYYLEKHFYFSFGTQFETAFPIKTEARTSQFAANGAKVAGQ